MVYFDRLRLDSVWIVLFVILSHNHVWAQITPPIAERPTGVTDGINYDSTDAGKVVLSLLAPGKDYAYVVGDFNNWTTSEDYLMNQTPDGERFWLEVSGLTPQTDYVFQYWVDGDIKIGDPFSDQLADPDDDPFIEESIYPDLPSFTGDGIASVIRTGQVAYEWSSNESVYSRGPMEQLIIYELLIRDFIGTHGYKDLIDTLNYLEDLGVNAIELMPIMEFEGNLSWGYNPSYFFAPDKYYGTKNDLKAFVDAAHQKGMAVILDMVLNHAFGENAMVRLYWDQANNRPAEDNPWFNPIARHPFNVGFDFNHESQYTQDFVDSVNLYWLDQYHFDGFRFDLSKGFTQNFTEDVGIWSDYDQSRIDLLTRMATKIWEYDSEAYVILEHFGSSSEEDELSDEGMALWRNMNFAFEQNLTAKNTNHNVSGFNSFSRVSYSESHDEQRQKYYMDLDGKADGGYNIKSKTNALERLKLGAAFSLLMPGPKMMWQFQELGYDVDINLNGRTGEKPLPWGVAGLGYFEDIQRQKLQNTYRALLQLRKAYADDFQNGSFSVNALSQVKWFFLEGDSISIHAIGNFGTTDASTAYNFSELGIWYDFFSSESKEVTDLNEATTLAPGELRVFVNAQIDFPESGLIQPYREIVITDPLEFHEKQDVTIIFDAAQAFTGGTGGLVGAQKVYMYSGAVTEPFSEQPTVFTGSTDQDNGIGLMTGVEGETDKWQITINPSQYYSVSEGTRIFKISMYFRDANGQNLGTGVYGSNIILTVQPDPDRRALWVEPANFGKDDEITIYYDAASADPPTLTGVSTVYLHSGIITTGPTGTGWENVVGNWGQDDGVGIMALDEGDTWKITLTPSVYYNISAATKVYRLGVVLRNADGSKEGKAPGGSDYFIDVPNTVTALDGSEDTGFRTVLYPNPASRTATLRLDPYAGDYPVRLTVFDSNGKELFSEEASANHSTSQPRFAEVKVDIQHLQNGLYLLVVEGRKRTQHAKLVISR